MALEEHSFQHLLPTFLISPGTQVVLKVDKPLPDGTVRQRGSVAVVAESPADLGVSVQKAMKGKS